MSDNNKLLFTVKNAVNTVSHTTANASDAIIKKATRLKDNIKAKQEENRIVASEKKKAEDLKRLSPIFEADISNGELLSERVIRIVNYDKRLENEVCLNSVGYYEISDYRKLPTIYTKFAQKLDLTFYPQLSDAVYIADPCIAGKYIEIDEYYNYMQQVRVNELTVVAQALNAKSISIKLKYDEKSKENASAVAKVNVMSLVKANGNMKEDSNSKSSVEIWAETTFKPSFWNGGPTMPQLLYFRNDSDISLLIQMVLTNRNKVKEKTYLMKASSSSGMSKNEALNIKCALNAFKCDAGANFEKNAEKESKAVLEYTIKF